MNIDNQLNKFETKLQKTKSLLNILGRDISKLVIASLTFVFVSMPLSTQEEMMEEQEVKKTEKPKEEEKLIDETKEKVDEQLRFYKEKYEFTSDKGFTDVWNAIVASLEEIDCQVMQKKETQTESGALKGTIQSDYCVFAMQGGQQKVKDSLEKYSYKMPIIRGAIWQNARMQYKFILKENEDMTTNVLIKGDLSGREGHVTNEVHFWQSNGMFETQMIDRIMKKLK